VKDQSTASEIFIFGGESTWIWLLARLVSVHVLTLPLAWKFNLLQQYLSAVHVADLLQSVDTVLQHMKFAACTPKFFSRNILLWLYHLGYCENLLLCYLGALVVTDMLRRLINCRIIIIEYISIHLALRNIEICFTRVVYDYCHLAAINEKL